MAQVTGWKVAFWDLEPSDAEQAWARSHQVEPCIRSSGVPDIGIFPEEEDARMPVNKADIQPGGKYHSIVKLFIKHQASDVWTTATGWLSRDDLVVTAAHCVLNGDHHATCVKVHIGYSASSESGHASFENQRTVSRIVLPSAWSDAKAEQSAIAFLQLDKPFQDVAPIQYDTPDTEPQQQLTVVGYPADVGARAGSPGGEMHYLHVRRKVDIEPARWNMLVYRGDSQGGFSGAPIIRDNDFAAVGVHVRGGGFNLGAAIGGRFGVNFQIYEEALEILGRGSQRDIAHEVSIDTDRKWLKYVHLPPRTTSQD